MLSRVEHVTNQQRQFVADASHELRGLLTRIRSDLEVSIAHPDTVDPDTMYRSLLTDATQLQQLIDNLLFLARSESSSISRPSTHVDHDDLVLEEARRLRDHGQVRVDASSVSAAQVLGDPNQLARAIRNLASNAERHAATTVRFELRECDGYGEVIVADDGPGIPAEHHARVSSGSRAWMTPVHGASAARVAALPSCMTSSSATGARSKSRRLTARGPGS